MNTGQARRPQLTTDELLHLKWLLGGALSLLAVGTIFYMDVDAWSLMFLTSAAAIAAMARPTWPARVPRLVHTLAFPAIVAFFVADLWLRGEVLPAMVRLDILLLLYRNISYRQRRDDLQLIVLGLFLVVVAGVLTVSLTFAAHLLIYTACALALLLVLTLTETAGVKAAAAKPPAPDVVPAWTQHANARLLLARLRVGADWRVIGLGAVLFAGVVAVSALLFLAIPRFQLENSMFLDRFISKKAKSGFSESISFGDVTEIMQDTSVALSVDVSDQREIPASPYWRMVPLDHYENGTFRLSVGLRNQEFQSHERTFSWLNGEGRPRLGPEVHWTFFLESGVSRYLPLLGHFNTLRFRETQTFRLAPRLAVVALREEPAAMMAYRVEGFELSPILADEAFAERWRARTPELLGRVGYQVLLRLREPDRVRLRTLVAEITGGREVTATEFAELAGAWLRKQHDYSLSPVIPRGEGDPLVRWLTSREAGHCELFAGSLVVLARSAGFPARVVTGFRGGTWNGYSNNFTIRNSDAHAWAEIFEEAAGGWLRADALAPEISSQSGEVRGEAALVSRLDRSWKARLDSLRVFWYRRIVSFDQRSQMETLKAVKDATQNTGKQLRQWLADQVSDFKAWLAQPWDLRRVATLLGAAGAVSALAWLWREFGRGWWRGLTRDRSGQKIDPVRREAARWLARIAGEERCGSEAQQLVHELQRLRFGARESWSEPEKVFRRARRAVREARRRARTTRP